VLQGDWASQACLEKPLNIKSHYFDASIASIAPEDAHAHASVYHQYATFAERQYHAVVKSPDMLRLKVYIERKTTEVKRRDDEITKARRQGQQHRHLEGERKKAQTLLNTDVALYTEYIKSRNIFLKQAVDMYARCLLHSGSFDDDAAIRLCSLWFANFDNTEDGLPSTIGDALAQVPSHKFVFLAHQLSARLSDTERTENEPTNQGNLLAVIIRMCREHPFHALFPVFCLQADSVSGKSSRHNSQSSQVVRAGAAVSILSRLRSDPSCAQRISSVELVCQVSLQWAKYPIKAMVTRNAQKTFDIPNAAEIRKLSKVQVPVITKHTPLDPTSRYDNCVWIEHYEPTFDVAGGVNVPKICKCVGSDGQKYKQLVRWFACY
jgi:serine-protein kinase ATM